MAGTLSREQAADLLVGEVMIPNPKTLPADAVVAEVRELFARKETVRTVLLVDGDTFRGAIEREGLATASDDEPALRYADAEPSSATPGTPMQDALALLDARHEPRLVVLDEDGATLRGLLCADSSGTGFCRSW